MSRGPLFTAATEQGRAGLDSHDHHQPCRPGTCNVEAGSPAMRRAATAGEKRAATNSRRCVTRYQKAQAKELIGA